RMWARGSWRVMSGQEAHGSVANRRAPRAASPPPPPTVGEARTESAARAAIDRVRAMRSAKNLHPEGRGSRAELADGRPGRSEWARRLLASRPEARASSRSRGLPGLRECYFSDAVDVPNTATHP